jgi:hypothetical protein
MIKGNFSSSVYEYNDVINGCSATLVNLPQGSIWCRVVKKNVNLLMFLEFVKPHFGLIPRKYRTIRVSRSIHILFFLGDEESPSDVVYNRRLVLEEKCLNQMRQILLFRELFSIRKTTEKSIAVRDGSLISIEEHCNNVLTSREVLSSATSQMMYDTWIKPFSYKEILIHLVMKEDESVIEFINRTMEYFSQFEADSDTALVINHFQRRIVELAVTR